MEKVRRVIKGIPSSFVFKNMKLSTDKGAGEAKLFIGPKSQLGEIEDFFRFNKGYRYKFDKSNLLEYLHEVKMEYVFQSINKYKDASLETWTEWYTAIENMQTSEMEADITEYIDDSRVYIRATKEIFSKIFRKIAVPKLTDIEFVRNDDIKEFLLLLHVNYGYENEKSEDISAANQISYVTDWKSSYPRNRILFGAPGTGKSFIINRDRKRLLGEDNEEDYERVTFHPDYSYANFVGTYKPIMVDDSYGNVSNDAEGKVLSVLTDQSKSVQEKYDLLYDQFKEDELTSLQILLGLYTDENLKTRKDEEIETEGDISVERNQGRAIRPYVNLFKSINVKKDISYEWNKLRKAINNFLAKEKINEDKQLGPYFISRSIIVPKEGDEINRNEFINTFKNKVIMYLFEDAAKQKRSKLFEGCFQNSSRYSKICKEFEVKGIGIFNHDIQLDCEMEDVKTNDDSSLD
jgi:hypothetical protein